MAEQVERWTFHRNHDGLLREIAGEESTSALSDDDEEFGDIVNQMEKGIQRKKRQGIHKTKFMYDEVPAELMLLPQEREMLATVRMKMDIARSVIRKKRCYRTTCTLVGLLTVFAGALITWRLLFSD